MIKLLFNLLRTSDPSRKFRIELDLMFWGSKHSRLVRKYFQRRIFYVYNCEISHTAKIASSVEFGHPIGVVIGSNAVVEDGCKIYQQVTLGSNLVGHNEMPIIRSNSIIASGAKVVGGISIGNNCIIGANSIVTKDVPSATIVVGANIHKKRTSVLSSAQIIDE
ncbi:serine acetyltransferase [Vibrio sp. A2-1]|uniref:serine O-acetyltransferase n=1 Tax=Vibrio sp. A2-1 TaxID=2912252 RepID=UPI001F2EB2F2|nr:serine acetyltransferase [Vibrio sp. A2-1]MCF7487677.1 serine acetyltransferase [Vibrio sp. A2-1]